MYIWQNKGWPDFHRDDSAILEALSTARHVQGLHLGAMAGLGFEVKLQTKLETITEDILKSSLIEGDVLPRNSVRSSVARRIGVPQKSGNRVDKRTDSIVKMMLDATQNFDRTLTARRLCDWQQALFPDGHSGLHRITTGAWRTDENGPMQIISGPYGRERVHYEAPPALQISAEMDRFLSWFNSRQEAEGLIRAALAHLWFITVHPFDDGNGRIARALTDMALAQCENSSMRFYSMSGQIERDRDSYYNILEETQKGSLDITSWIVWFLNCFTLSIREASVVSSQVLKRAAFWVKHQAFGFSDRQRHILTRILEGFQGNITAKRWVQFGDCSVATAQRDINELVAAGIVVQNLGGSKNTSYSLADH